MSSREVEIKDQIINLWCKEGVIIDEIFSRCKLDTEFIERHSDELDWDILSRNENLPWSIDFIVRHKDSLDWKAISCNKGIRFAQNILNEFSDKLDVIALMENNLIAPDKALIINNKHKIKHGIMLLYHPVNFRLDENFQLKYPFLRDFDFIEAFLGCKTEYDTLEDYIDWNQISRIEQLISNADFLLRYRKSLNWNEVSSNLNITDNRLLKAILKEFEAEFDWSLLKSNPCCTIVIETEFQHKYSNRSFESGERGRWREEFTKLKKRGYDDAYFESLFFYYRNVEIKKSPYRSNPLHELFTGGNDVLLENPDQLWNEKVLEKVLIDFQWKFSWSRFSKQTNVDWSLSLLKKYERNLDWRQLSENRSINWEESLLDEFKHLVDWYQLAHNPTINWSDYLICRYKDFVDWQGLADNPSISWTESLIDRCIEEIDWAVIGRSPALTQWNTNMFIKYCNNLGIEDEDSPVYDNIYIEWDAPLLSSLKSKLNWRCLLYNRNIEWTPDMIYPNRDYWFNAFGDGSICPMDGELKVFWDLEILSRIKYWSLFIENNYFHWHSLKTNIKSVSWLDCIVPYLTYDDLEKLINRRNHLIQEQDKYYEELRSDYEVDLENCLKETEESETQDIDRDNFNEMTDGQYGNYDDWIDRGKDMDDLNDMIGR